MAIRKSVRGLSTAEQDNFINAVKALKAERNSSDDLSTYDRYVVWHAASMMNRTPWPGDLGATIVDRFQLSQRNSAHRGPSFLPWHREFLRRFELDLQRVSGDSSLGLPYWDWENDGELSANEQRDVSVREIWQLVGGDGSPGLANMVTSGPFSFDPTRINDPTVFDDPDVWITVDGLGRRVGFLQRAMGRARVPQLDPATGQPVIDPVTGQRVMEDVTLPNNSQVNAAVAINTYDSDNWDEQSDQATSFRNVLEGWVRAPGLHNRVHVWVGGSMGPGTSPNDPVFFLHHCNVDRIWSLWQTAHPSTGYVPETDGPFGHKLNDPMYPWNGVETPEIVSPAVAIPLGDVEYLPPPP